MKAMVRDDLTFAFFGFPFLLFLQCILYTRRVVRV